MPRARPTAHAAVELHHHPRHRPALYTSRRTIREGLRPIILVAKLPLVMTITEHLKIGEGW
jgi:hypothetical protein